MARKKIDLGEELLSRIESIGGEVVHFTAPHNWPSLVADREGWDADPAAGLKASEETVKEAVEEWADMAGFLYDEDETEDDE